MTPLDCAIEIGKPDLVEEILKFDLINPNTGGKILNSSLNFAVNLLKGDIVDILLKHPKISLNIVDDNGNSVFHTLMKRFAKDI